MKILCEEGLLEYDTQSGEMRWLVARSNRVNLNKPISQPKDYKHYPQFRIDNKLKLVHRVAWEAINGPIPKGMEINHKNGIRNDNRLDNLELVTHQQNMAHAKRTGLTPRCTRPERALIGYKRSTGDGIYFRNSVVAKHYGFRNATIVAQKHRSNDKDWVFEYMEN